jgi:hypothetical protein
MSGEAPPAKRRSSAVKIIAIIALAGIVIIGVIGAITAFLSGGVEDSGYYQIGGERLPSVAYALGEEREIVSLKTNTANGVETLSAVYDVSGAKQGEDIREYFGYLQGEDGFVMRSDTGDAAFDEKTGAEIQVWRNAVEPGYMIIVQADYDERGYTITVMRGEGQVTGGASSTSALSESQSSTTETPSTGTPSTQTPAPTGEFSSLLPAGEPTSTSTFYDYTIASYADGTVSVNEGRGIIYPDGTVYLNGELYPSNGVMEIPGNSDDRIEVNNAVAVMVDNQLYIVANGGVIYVDSGGTGYAYTTS